MRRNIHLAANGCDQPKQDECRREAAHHSGQGMCRKAEMLVFVGAANAADLLLNSHFLRSAVIIGFCASEALSLTENAGRMGIPMPAAWKNAVSLLSRKAQPDSPSEQE